MIVQNADSWIPYLEFQHPNQATLFEGHHRDRSRDGLGMITLVSISASAIYWPFDLNPSGEWHSNSSAHRDQAESLGSKSWQGRARL